MIQNNILYGFKRNKKIDCKTQKRLQTQSFTNKQYFRWAQSLLVLTITKLVLHPVFHKTAYSVQIVGGEVIYVKPAFVCVSYCRNFCGKRALHVGNKFVQFFAFLCVFFLLRFRIEKSTHAPSSDCRNLSAPTCTDTLWERLPKSWHVLPKVFRLR